jgi:integrase
MAGKQKRRGNSEGGITKRFNRDGKLVGWQVRILLPNGKRKTLGTAPTWSAAVKMAQQGQIDLASGRLSASPRQSLSDFLDAWLEFKKESVRYKTIVSYKLNVSRATRFLGDIRLDALKPAHIVQWHSDLSKTGLSRRSVQQAHVVLHTALEHALRLELVNRNPLDAVRPPQAERKEMQTLSLEQSIKLFEATEGQGLHALWVTLATTGLRINEALALKWDDVDLEARTTTIQRGLERQKGKGLLFTSLKSASSRRNVTLMPMAVDALSRHRTRQKEQRLLVGPMWQEQGLVFASVIGRPLDYTDVGRWFKNELAQAGLPKIKVHGLRHTAATLQLQQGTHPSVVQQMLGHSSISLTLGTYSHVGPTMQRDASDRLEDAFTAARAKKKLSS